MMTYLSQWVPFVVVITRVQPWKQGRQICSGATAMFVQSRYHHSNDHIWQRDVATWSYSIRQDVAHTKLYKKGLLRLCNMQAVL